jgi:hypothetical protein
MPALVQVRIRAGQHVGATDHGPDLPAIPPHGLLNRCRNAPTWSPQPDGTGTRNEDNTPFLAIGENFL